MVSKVTVLMSTYNGEKYLEKQLESLFNQLEVDIYVYVRDDGSSDNTVHILNKWQESHQLQWYHSENLGPALSFMDLVKTAPKSDYYAFCDQDDVWDNNKLLIATEKLKTLPKIKPGLYFSSYRLVDENLKLIKNNEDYKNLSFGNALIQNISLGCTMVFNYSAKEIAAKNIDTDGSLHDAWLYKLWYSTGNVIYDREPRISYRQHESNVVGGQRNFIGKWTRRKKRFMKIWNGRKSNHLIKYYELTKNLVVDQDKEKTIKLITNYKKSMKNTLSLFFDKNIVMQDPVDTFLMKILILVRRF